MARRRKFTVDDINPDFIETELSLIEDGVQRRSPLVNTLKEFGHIKRRKRDKYVNRSAELISKICKKYSKRGYF